jgi:hypothetical protein
MLPAISGMTGAHHHTQLFSIEMGVSQIFFLGWPRTVSLLISKILL